MKLADLAAVAVGKVGNFLAHQGSPDIAYRDFYNRNLEWAWDE